MKFSILGIFAVTTIIGLGIALYVEHTGNSKRELALKTKHAEQLDKQKAGLSVHYSVVNLLRVSRDRLDRSVRQDYDAQAMGLIVSMHDNAEFFDQDRELKANYGQRPSLTLTAALLEHLKCKSFDEYIQKYCKKIEFMGMKGKEQDFGLGFEESERRAELSEFVSHALDEQSQIMTFK